MAFVIPIINTLLLLCGAMGLVVGLAIAPWQVQLVLLLAVLLGTQYTLRKTGAIRVFEQFQESPDAQKQPNSIPEPCPSDLPPWATLADRADDRSNPGSDQSTQMHPPTKLVYRGHGYPPNSLAQGASAPAIGNHHGSELCYRGVKLGESSSESSSEPTTD